MEEFISPVRWLLLMLLVSTATLAIGCWGHDTDSAITLDLDIRPDESVVASAFEQPSVENMPVAMRSDLREAASSSVEVVNVNVKRKPYDPTWNSYETLIVGQNERLAIENEPAKFNRYGGDGVSVGVKTGFFHVQELDGTWAIVDPDGCRFISKGVNSVKIGRAPVSKTAFEKKFGVEGNWSQKTVSGLRDAGFNTLGSWSQWWRFRNIDSRMPYTVIWNFMSTYGEKIGGVHQESGHVGYPNGCIFVFDKAFEKHCDEHAQRLHQLEDDPFLIGYFSDNEMPWKLDMLDRYLELKNSEEGYIAATDWLKDQGVNRTQITDQVREAFVEYAAEKYFSTVKQAIRKHDRNHMYLGCRFHGAALSLKPLFKAAEKHLDIISINWYWEWTPDTKKMDIWKQWASRPFIISEFYAKGMDSGMGNTSGAGWVVETQRDRGYFYQNFALGLLKHPNCVGWHWHRYMDNSAGASRDPSNVDSNKGVVTSKYEPHKDLISEMAIMNAEVYKMRDRRFGGNADGQSTEAKNDVHPNSER